MAKSQRKRKSSSTTDLSTRSTVSVGGRRTYASQFIEVVVAYAMKNGPQEASVYYDVPTATIGRWVRQTKKMNSKKINGLVKASDNPFRETTYNLQRRMRLSDKLFGELEMTVEAERIKNGGYIPAHVLAKLTSSFSNLVDKRRLEEGAHTALVQEAKEPEDIFAEGQARVVEFKRRFALPEGTGQVAEIPDSPGRKERTRG